MRETNSIRHAAAQSCRGTFYMLPHVRRKLQEVAKRLRRSESATLAMVIETMHETIKQEDAKAGAK